MTLYNFSRYLLTTILILMSGFIVWMDVELLLRRDPGDGEFIFVMLIMSIIWLSPIALLVVTLLSSQHPYRQLAVIVLPISFFVFFFLILPDYWGFYEYHLKSIQPGGADPMTLGAILLVYCLIVIFLTQRLSRFLRKRFFGEQAVTKEQSFRLS